MAFIATLPDASVDSCVTDPPYHLTTGKKGGTGPASLNTNSPAGRSRVTTGFMGKAWDGGDIAHRVEMWAEVLRVLKPGAHLLAFAGTRTYHRMVCAIEDAGFEIRDQMAWMYGSGFPKSMDVSKAIDKAAGAEREVVAAGKPMKRMIPGADQDKSGSWVKDNGREFIPTTTAPATEAAKQWDGWGTALKPAWEPIVVARKPLIGTVCENVLQHGCGALNIDGCRIAGTVTSNPLVRNAAGFQSNGLANQGATGGAVVSEGRWPANIIHDGSDEVVAMFPETTSGANPTRRGAPKFRNTYSEFQGQEKCEAARGADSGNAARFFKSCPFDEQDAEIARLFYSAKAGGDERDGNTHATVKPLALMRYLVRLVTPPGGTVLDHFAGSGSTLIAARQEGFSSLGCDLESDHVAIINARLAKELL